MALNAGTAYVEVLPEMGGFATGVGKGLNRIGNQITRSSRVLTRGITIPVAAAGAASIKMALDFETSMQRVGALTQASRGQVQKWSDEILTLGPKLGTAPNDFAQALYFVASSGAKVAQVMPITTQAVKLAAAGMGDASTVAQILTSAVNAYGESNLSAAQAADVLTEAIKVGKAEPAALASALGRVIPLAQTMGVTFAETAASVSTLTNTGLSAAEATTALRAVLTTMVKPAQQTKDEYKKLGLTVEGLQKSIAQHGLNDTLVALKKRIGDNKDALGKLFPNVRALTGFLALTGKNAAQVARNVDLVTHSTGAANEAFKRAAESDAFKFRKALASLEAEAVKLGSVLLPFASQLLSDVTSLIAAFKGLSPETQRLVLAFVGLLAVIGPVGTLIGNLTIITSVVIRGLSLLGTALYSLATAFTVTEVATTSTAASFSLYTGSVAAAEAATVPLVSALSLVAIGLAAITSVAFLAYITSLTDPTTSFAASERDAVNATNDLASALEELKTGHIAVKQANLDHQKAVEQLAKDERAQAKFVRANGHENHQLAQQIEQDGITVSSAEVRQAQAHAQVADAQKKQRESTNKLFKAQAASAKIAQKNALLYERRLNPAFLRGANAATRLKEKTELARETAQRFAAQQSNVVKKTLETEGAFGKGKERAVEFALAAQHLAEKLGAVPSRKQVTVELNKNLPYYLGLVSSLKSEIDSLPSNKTTRIHVITERALGGRAAGGPVSSGTPYLVGERGPELFVPNNSGNIVPNHALVSGRGGRHKIVIENWEDGTGYMEDIADSSVGRNSGLNRQKRRMNR